MGKKRLAETVVSSELETDSREKVLAKGKTRAKLDSSHIYISSSYNNTCLTVTDSKGNVLAWASAGSVGFKGPKKATPFAASRVVDVIIGKIGIDLGRVDIYVRGIGGGRDAAIRALANKGLNIVSMHDVTPIPHNGCRPPKPRRV